MRLKAQSMPLVLVISAVVLLVVGLLVISITSGGLSNFFGSATEQQTEAGSMLGEASKSAYEEMVEISYGDDTRTTNTPSEPAAISQELKPVG